MAVTELECPKCATVAINRDFCSCGEYLGWELTTADAGQGPAEYRAPAPPAPRASTLLTLRDPAREADDAGADVAVTVVPGEAVTVLATVRNQGEIVDTYDVRVEGLPDAWWTITTPTVFLNPWGTSGDYEQELQVRLHPPRTSESVAGLWAVTVVVRSRSLAEDVAAVPATADGAAVHPHRDGRRARASPRPPPRPLRGGRRQPRQRARRDLRHRPRHRGAVPGERRPRARDRADRRDRDGARARRRAAAAVVQAADRPSRRGRAPHRRRRVRSAARGVPAEAVAAVVAADGGRAARGVRHRDPAAAARPRGAQAQGRHRRRGARRAREEGPRARADDLRHGARGRPGEHDPRPGAGRRRRHRQGRAREHHRGQGGARRPPSRRCTGSRSPPPPRSSRPPGSRTIRNRPPPATTGSSSVRTRRRARRTRSASRSRSPSRTARRPPAPRRSPRASAEPPGSPVPPVAATTAPPEPPAPPVPRTRRAPPRPPDGARTGASPSGAAGAAPTIPVDAAPAADDASSAAATPTPSPTARVSTATAKLPAEPRLRRRHQRPALPPHGRRQAGRPPDLGQALPRDADADRRRLRRGPGRRRLAPAGHGVRRRQDGHPDRRGHVPSPRLLTRPRPAGRHLRGPAVRPRPAGPTGADVRARQVSGRPARVGAGRALGARPRR